MNAFRMIAKASSENRNAQSPEVYSGVLIARGPQQLLPERVFF